MKPDTENRFKKEEAKGDKKGNILFWKKEAKKYIIKEGHFAPGSMLPKISAAINFLVDGNNGNREVIITKPENISWIIQGETGIKITKN